jgi:threonine/homoserine/homoserine lactone efflux protein
MEINFALNTPLYFAFAWFVWVASITPGPNCALALAVGIHHGVRPVWRHALGVCLGMTGLMMAALWASKDLFQRYPFAALALKVFGIAFLVYLGWAFIKAARSTTGDAATPMVAKPSVMRSVLMQLSNPKAWLLVTGTLGAYQGLAHSFWINALVIMLTFYVAIVTSVYLWAWMGQAIRRWLDVGRRMQAFNVVLGLSLLITALWLVWQ